MDAIVLYRVCESSGDRILSDDLIELLGPEFSRYYV
jgi:hypothetical protein